MKRKDADHICPMRPPKPTFHFHLDKGTVLNADQIHTKSIHWNAWILRMCFHLWADSEIVMVDLAFGDDFFWTKSVMDDFGTTISGISGTHQNLTGSRMPVLLIIPRVDNRLDSFWWNSLQNIEKQCFLWFVCFLFKELKNGTKMITSCSIRRVGIRVAFANKVDAEAI